MPCGNEISDCDDNAVKDSEAGKNTELDSEIMKEFDEYNVAKDILQEKTNGFEQLRDENGNAPISNEQVSDNLARVEIAREVLNELNISRIEFVDKYTGYRGQASPTQEGRLIQIYQAGDHKDSEAVMRTIFHEIGESYFQDRLTNNEFVGEDKAKENAHFWENCIANAPNNPRGEYLDKTEKGIDKVVASGHYFGNQFAAYCIAEILTQKGDKEVMNGIKEDFPLQHSFFEKMLNEFRKEG